MREPNYSRRGRQSSDAGFSLIEILIAVMILVLMGGIVMKNVFPHFFQAKRDRAQLEVDTIKSAIEAYRLRPANRTNRLPEQSEFPQVLVEAGENGEEPLLNTDTLTDGKLLDPWGFEYQYVRHTGSSFEVISFGDDNAPGGEGNAADISTKKGGDGGGGRSGK